MTLEDKIEFLQEQIKFLEKRIQNLEIPKTLGPSYKGWEFDHWYLPRVTSTTDVK